MDLREILLGVGAQVAQNARIGDPTAEAYVRRVGSFLQHASKWAAVSNAGIKCDVHTRSNGGVHPCAQPAISACVVCRQPVCYGHGMISPSDGTVICFACVGEAQTRRHEDPPKEAPDPSTQCICRTFNSLDPRCPVHGFANAPPFQSDPDEDVLCRKHLRRLGLTGEASWLQIRAAHKALAKEHHPDRFKGAERARREKKLKQINESFEWLKRHQERRAA